MTPLQTFKYGYHIIWLSYHLLIVQVKYNQLHSSFKNCNPKKYFWHKSSVQTSVLSFFKLVLPHGTRSVEENSVGLQMTQNVLLDTWKHLHDSSVSFIRICNSLSYTYLCHPALDDAITLKGTTCDQNTDASLNNVTGFASYSLYSWECCITEILICGLTATTAACNYLKSINIMNSGKCIFRSWKHLPQQYILRADSRQIWVHTLSYTSSTSSPQNSLLLGSVPHLESS